MLYQRWLSVLKRFESELALVDLDGGRRWSFRDLAEAVAQVPTGDSIVFPSGNHVGFLVDLLAAWRDARVVCPLDPSQAKPDVPNAWRGVAHLKLTSATTGKARLIAFTEAQLSADLDNIMATMALRRDQANLGVIPLSHSYGFSNLVLPLLLEGMPLILAPGAYPEILQRASSEVAELVVPAVPALWQIWMHGTSLPSNLKVAISAGAPLPIAIEKCAFEKFGLKIHNFYGSSECGGIAYDRSTMPRENALCVGSPMEHVQVSTAASGALIVESDAVALGYWPQPSETLGNGRFETSDLGELRGGLIFIQGRAGDVINVAGRKLHPETLEAALMKHPAVRDCIVFGIPDGHRGETPVACVCLENEVVPEGGLADFLRGEIPEWQLPRHWWFVDHLDANERGKRSRSDWRQRFSKR